jgi:hypothetical protein
VSFKLETDESILNKKVIRAFQTSKSHAIVSNLLQFRSAYIYYNFYDEQTQELQTYKILNESGELGELEDRLIWFIKKHIYNL